MSQSVRPVVELRDISVEYPGMSGPVRAIDAVSLDVNRGESLAIVGRSGSGKSSLVGVMGLMRTPTSGTHRIGGELVPTRGRARARVRAESVGMVFQSFHLDPHLTAQENAMMPWFWTGGGRYAEARQRAMANLEQVGLGELADRRVAEMSGGERQRVAIARAIFSRPRLLIADEPTGNLDEENATLVARLLFAVASAGDTAVVLVTHDLAVAEQADRTARLSRGRLVDGPPLTSVHRKHV